MINAFPFQGIYALGVYIPPWYAQLWHDFICLRITGIWGLSTTRNSAALYQSFIFAFPFQKVFNMLEMFRPSQPYFGLRGGWLTFWVTVACATDMMLFGYDQGVFGNLSHPKPCYPGY